MKLFYYMTSSSLGIKQVYALSHWAVYMSEKSWYGSGTTIVVWDDNNDTRIFHGRE